jgi:hypothetical protein
MRLAFSLAFAFATALLAVSSFRAVSAAPRTQGGTPGTVDTVAADGHRRQPANGARPLDDCSQVEPGNTLTFDVIIDSVHPQTASAATSSSSPTIPPSSTSPGRASVLA